MSSGYYLFAPTVPSYSQRQKDKLEQLKKQREHVDAVYNNAVSSLEKLCASLSECKNISATEYSATVKNVGSIETVESEGVQSGLALDNLLFADISSSREEIVFVAVDFSEELLSAEATDSTEARKMRFASAILKKTLLLCVGNKKEEEELTEFNSLINSMLDDKSVTLDFFCEHITERYDALAISLGHDDDINDKDWNVYCSLCAMLGKRPRRISASEIADEIDSLFASVYRQHYVSAAKEAFIETLAELGLSVIGDYELEGVEGTLIQDEENPDYRLYYSENSMGFALEAVETGNSQRSVENHHSICSKRVQIAEKMSEKGFAIKH